MAGPSSFLPEPCTADAATNLDSGFLSLGFSPLSLPFGCSLLFSISDKRLPISLSLSAAPSNLTLSHLDWTKAMSWPWGLVMSCGLWR
uniref:Uncharacterized protein n=1 Tax=Fagus sylvatica TaxID=28930 RepID=A0A2N9GM29_FAGSY